MNTKTYKVESFLVKYYCPKCEHEVVKDNMVLTSYPVQYVYFCPKCGHRDTSYVSYPKIEYKEIVEA